MFARAILMLLLALQALPVAAMPACHAAPQPMAHLGAHEGAHGGAHRGAHHQPRREAPATQEQLCLGCIAPATIAGPALAPPLAFARPVAVIERTDGLALPANPPATPPPRLA
ncbi:hypothetical protein [Sphingomonas sp.]|uniref:hypothetical protein n=1 Tax=Sphingomonas sp. TaxID=28214 RepID=UPI001B2304CC|nr:hypothetical protein [Sphingomonas sp.]MBO9713634.1 hypothetical protein [Sphingomonas sp.]